MYVFSSRMEEEIQVHYYHLFAVSSQFGKSLQTMSCKRFRWADSSSAIKPCGNTGLHPYAYSFAINSSLHLLWNCKGTAFCPGEWTENANVRKHNPSPPKIVFSEAGNFFHCCSKWIVLCLETWQSAGLSTWQQVIPGYEKLLLRVVELATRKYSWDFEESVYRMLQ